MYTYCGIQENMNDTSLMNNFLKLTYILHSLLYAKNSQCPSFFNYISYFIKMFNKFVLKTLDERCFDSLKMLKEE